MRPARSDRIIGLALALAAAAFWLALLWRDQGALLPWGAWGDSAGYLALARALLEGHAGVAERPDRMPGYPLLLLASQGIAALGDWNRLSVVVVVQTLLLSGVGTWLVFDAGRRLGGLAVGVPSALIYAMDVDLQVFGRYVLSEAQAVSLMAGASWIRIRDGDWRRARWVIAVLALTRPNLACLTGGVAGLELLCGRSRTALSVVWPTMAALGIWMLFAQSAGGSPIEASRRIQALCRFGTAYEAGLWEALPPGALRATLARASHAGRTAYGAARALTGQREPWNPGADWRPMATAATAMFWADPLGYAGARLSLIAAVHERSSTPPWGMRPADEPSWPPDPWQLLARVSRAYHSVLFGSFGLFCVLLAVAAWNGWGFAPAVEPMRLVVAPLLVSLWIGTAMLSLSDYEIVRLGLPAHPLAAVVWGLVAARVFRLWRPATID